MPFLDDLKGALASGWEFFYSLPNLYPLRYKNASGANDMATGSIGGEIAEYFNSDGVSLIKIDNRGIVGRMHGGLPGEIRFGAWTTAFYDTNLGPYGWLKCLGQTVARATYPILYDAIGDQFAIGGEAAEDFRLPNLDARSPVGAGASAVGTLLGAATFSIAAHTHAVANHAHTIAAHGHTIPTHTHQYAHTHGQPTHDHAITGADLSHTHGVGTLDPTSTSLDQETNFQEGTAGNAQDVVIDAAHGHGMTGTSASGTPGLVSTNQDGNDTTNSQSTETSGAPSVALAADSGGPVTTGSGGTTPTDANGAITNQNLYHPSTVVHAIIWTGQGG